MCGRESSMVQTRGVRAAYCISYGYRYDILDTFQVVQVKAVQCGVAQYSSSTSNVDAHMPTLIICTSKKSPTKSKTTIDTNAKRRCDNYRLFWWILGYSGWVESSEFHRLKSSAHFNLMLESWSCDRNIRCLGWHWHFYISRSSFGMTLGFFTRKCWMTKVKKTSLDVHATWVLWKGKTSSESGVLYLDNNRVIVSSTNSWSFFTFGYIGFKSRGDILMVVSRFFSLGNPLSQNVFDF